MPGLTVEDIARLDESFRDTFDVSGPTQAQSGDMHVMYQIADSFKRECFDMREEMRHKNRNRDREIDMVLLLKLAELTTLLTGKETEAKSMPSQNDPIKDSSKSPIVADKWDTVSKAVSFGKWQGSN